MPIFNLFKIGNVHKKAIKMIPVETRSLCKERIEDFER